MGLFKRKTPEVELTNDRYARWLRAGRPQPMAWFLGLSDDDQEGLAAMGDEYAQDVCLAIGLAVQDPQAAGAGLDALGGDLDAEESLVHGLAVAAVRKHMGAPPAPSIVGRHTGAPAASVPMGAVSMGGVTERREARAGREQAGKDAGRSFMGRKPDGIPA